jgi:DNA (cytosine-5)-methyltransferase 1
MKVLNLYAGIGGNRKLWPTECEVTAVEIDPEIAVIYQKNFPQDTVIVGDAHQYLLDHYGEYDFIWSSPPCPSHSRVRFMASKHGSYDKVFPDLKLYEEVIFLTNFCGKAWVIENVIGYYEPLIPAKEVSRHYFWANFVISEKRVEQRNHNHVSGATVLYGFDLREEKLEKRKDQIIRNCVHPDLGLHIFRCAFKEKQQIISME